MRFAWLLALPVLLGADRFAPVDDAKARLGRLLFYDKVLSGDFAVSCGTCHDHARASSNGALLEGAEPIRDEMAIGGLTAYERLKPSAEHAPTLFNLGHESVDALFYDGRIERLPDGRWRTPLDGSLPEGLDSILAVQALFPAVTTGEQAGNGHGNELEAALAQDRREAWDLLAARVRDLPPYRPHFEAAFPGKPIDIVSIANAIGAFVASEWRADDSRYDRFLRGEASLSAEEERGRALFFGAGNCASCHSGPFMGGGFHDAGFPDGTVAEPGRVAVSGDPTDRGAIRTPQLRNVTRTGPWGHGGTFDTLESLLRAHAPTLDRRQRADMLDFLETLTDEASLRGRLGKPGEVPSGLAID